MAAQSLLSGITRKASLQSSSHAAEFATQPDDDERTLADPSGTLRSPATALKPCQPLSKPSGAAPRSWPTASDAVTGTSNTILAPTISTTPFTTTTRTQTCSRNNIHKPDPIHIPPPTLQPRDINRVPTPLSGRGDRKGHLFPYSRTPSPRPAAPSPIKRKKRSSFEDELEVCGRLERVRSDSSSYSSQSARSMHSEHFGSRYPASPLSPKLPTGPRPRSPQSSQRKGNHGRQSSRTMHLNLGRFHPSNFPQADAPAATPSSTVQSPAIMINRVNQPVQMETPRLMKEKHREFLEKARLSSKLAASPLATKPDAPRLNPLGSPKGPVTPLELEEPGDYFQVVSTGRRSPAVSPGGRSLRSNSTSSNEDTKPKKSRKVDIYH